MTLLSLYYWDKSFGWPVNRAQFGLKSDQTLMSKVTTFSPALPEQTVLFGAEQEWVVLVWLQ